MPSRQGYWRVPQLWPGGECFILGGGPGLHAEKDGNGEYKSEIVDQLQGRRVLAVNMAYRLGSWIPVLYFGDCRWLDWNREKLNNFAGLKVTSCDRHLKKPGIQVVKRKNGPSGIARNSNEVYWNLNSGGCAINLAYHFGVKRIVLLGFDMRPAEREGGDLSYNWHDYYPPKKMGPGKKHNPYPRFLRAFPKIAEDLKSLGVECVNATPGSALDVFPIVQPEEVI